MEDVGEWIRSLPRLRQAWLRRQLRVELSDRVVDLVQHIAVRTENTEVRIEGGDVVFLRDAKGTAALRC